MYNSSNEIPTSPEKRYQVFCREVGQKRFRNANLSRLSRISELRFGMGVASKIVR